MLPFSSLEPRPLPILTSTLPSTSIHHHRPIIIIIIIITVPPPPPLNLRPHPLQPVILHAQTQRDQRHAHANRDYQQDIHRLLVRAVDGLPRRRALVVLDRVQVAPCNIRGLAAHVRGQVRLELGGDLAGPDGAADGVADGAANLEDGEEDGGRGGDLLVRGGGLDAELRGDVDEAAADADDDLAADDGGERGGGLPVVQHEADAEEVDAGARGDEVFVVAGVLDEDADGHGGDGGGEGEGLGHVAAGGDGEVLDDEEVAEEVGLDGEVECHCVGVGRVG